MDKSLKQIKPMLCPVCGRFYFSELTDVDIEQLRMTPNTTQCSRCGWFYDLEQVANPDLEHESNEMSLNQYKKCGIRKKSKKILTGNTMKILLENPNLINVQSAVNMNLKMHYAMTFARWPF